MWVACLTAALLVTACSAAPANQAASGVPMEKSGLQGVLAPVPTPTPTVDAVAQRVAGMTLDQKVGQLFMVAKKRATPMSDLQPMIARGEVGSIIIMDAGWTMDEASQVTATLNSYVKAGAPGLYLAVDQEGGQVQHFSGAGFTAMPSALDQGAMPTAELTAQATTWGAELRQAGINIDLAPTADTVPISMLDTNMPIAHYDRQYGSDSAQVGAHSAAFIKGMTAGGVQTCVKHFPGLGYVTGNTDVTTVGITDDVTTRGDANLGAFATAIAAGPSAVMVSSATYSKIDPANPAMFSPVVIGQVLRGDLGWQGVVISDTLDATSVSAWTPGQRAVDFISAGGDIALFTSWQDIQPAFAAVKAKAAADPAFAAQVDAAVTRILSAKQAAGLLPG